MDFLKIISVCLVGVIVISCIPYKDKAVNSLISISVCVIAMLYAASLLAPAVEGIKNLTAGRESRGFELILKITGISLLTQFVSDVAADSGNKSLSNIVVFAGRVTIVFLSLPVYTQVIELIGGILK